MDEQQLIKRAKKGDQKAINDLYLSKYQLVRTVALSITKVYSNEVDDAIQECFFIYLRAVQDYKHEKGASFSNYLRKCIIWHLPKYLNSKMHIVAIPREVNSWVNTMLKRYHLQSLTEESFRNFVLKQFPENHFLAKRIVYAKEFRGTKALIPEVFYKSVKGFDAEEKIDNDNAIIKVVKYLKKNLKVKKKKKRGPIKRKIDIFLSVTVDGKTGAEVAREFNLTRASIGKINRECIEVLQRDKPYWKEVLT